MADTTHEPPATPAEIWNILRAVSKEQETLTKEQAALSRQQQETERFLKEQAQETGRLLKKQAEDSERSLNRLKGVFTSQWGELVESLVQGDLVPLMQARGVAVDSIHQRVEGRRNGEHYEFDIVAGNGEEVVVVEVKTTLRSEDVAHFLDKLRRFTTYQPLYRGNRVYGAVAYLKADGAVVKYAQRQGLFVIRATGKSARIVNTQDFKPAIFS